MKIVIPAQGGIQRLSQRIEETGFRLSPE